MARLSRQGAKIKKATKFTKAPPSKAQNRARYLQGAKTFVSTSRIVVLLLGEISPIYRKIDDVVVSCQRVLRFVLSDDNAESFLFDPRAFNLLVVQKPLGEQTVRQVEYMQPRVAKVILDAAAPLHDLVQTIHNSLRIQADRLFPDYVQLTQTLKDVEDLSAEDMETNLLKRRLEEDNASEDCSDDDSGPSSTILSEKRDNVCMQASEARLAVLNIREQLAKLRQWAKALLQEPVWAGEDDKEELKRKIEDAWNGLMTASATKNRYRLAAFEYFSMAVRLQSGLLRDCLRQMETLGAHEDRQDGDRLLDADDS
jgi:hypothetical protein